MRRGFVADTDRGEISMPKRFPIYLALACLAVFFHCVPAVFAADPVEIAVTGVEGDALENARQALALPYGLVRDGKVDRLWLERFAKQAPEKVRQALQPYGYYKSEVSARVGQTRDGKLNLQVVVNPGEPVRVTEVTVELKGAGAEGRRLRRMRDAFPVRPGEVLLQPDYERGKGALQALAQKMGYLDASFPRHEIRISEDRSKARIALVLDTGPRFYFGQAVIQGAPDYPDSYLKRFVAFKEGEPFSYAKVGETQLNFANSERFRQVVVTPERERAENARVPVVVQLTEAPRRTVRPGVGYGTDTGARFSTHYRDLNLFHKGHDLDLSLYAAQRLQGFAGRYTIPSTSDYRSSTSLQLNLQKEDVTSYLSKIVALELDRNIGLGRGQLATAYVRLLQEVFTVGDENANSRLVLPGFRFSKETFNDLVRPRRGYAYTLELRGAHPYLGSDTGLIQGIAHANLLFPLPWRLSLQSRGDVAYSLLDDPFSELPPSIRFFAGGDQSVRGYSYQSLGPRDASGQVVGGKHLLVGSLELLRSLYKDWGVSVFYDIGNAFNNYADMRLKDGTGVGIHYYTAVGGLNLYLAKPLATGAGSFRIHFTVGFQL